MGIWLDFVFDSGPIQKWPEVDLMPPVLFTVVIKSDVTKKRTEPQSKVVLVVQYMTEKHTYIIDYKIHNTN